MAFGQENQLWHPNLILDEDQLIRNAELGMELGPTMGGNIGFGQGGHTCVRTEELCAVKISTGACLPPRCDIRIDVIKKKKSAVTPIDSCDSCPPFQRPKRVEILTEQCSRPLPVPYVGSEDGTKVMFLCVLANTQECDGTTDDYTLSMQSQCMGGGPPQPGFENLSTKLERCMRKKLLAGGGPQGGDAGCDAVCAIAGAVLGTPRPGGGAVGGTGSYQECNRKCGEDDMSVAAALCRQRCYRKAGYDMLHKIADTLKEMGC